MMEPSIIPTRPPQYQTTKCPKCTVVLEYQLQQPSPNLKPTNVNGLGPSASTSPYSKLQCYSCNYLFPIPVTPQPSPTPSAKSFSSASKFRPGTDSSPLSMEYYEILGVSHLATPAEIKKAYYSLAMKYHPDKCRDLSHEEAEEKFKKISEAYQVLSDPVLRKKYNEFGPKGSCPEGGFMNPEEFFQAQFGGDRFIDIIGELAIAKHFKSAMVDEEDEEESEKSGEIANTGDSTTTAGAGTSVSNGTSSSSAKHRRLQKRLEEYELRRQERDERIKKLAENLVNKLKSYDPSNPHEFRSKIEAETEELKIQNYGLQLLHSTGYIYTNKSVEYLSKDEFLGLGSWMTKMKLKGHAIGETFSTIKSAVDVHKSFIELQEEEKRGWGGREDIKAKMEEEAARRGIDALWQGSKLEIESVLKGVCDRVLGDATVERGERKRRADGLKIIGEVYRGAKLE